MVPKLKENIVLIICQKKKQTYPISCSEFRKIFNQRQISSGQKENTNAFNLKHIQR